MQSALMYAFCVVACTPMVGIWRGHVWAKRRGMALRTVPATQGQTA